MKKKIAGRLGLTALALTFITTSVMSGTLAKYTMNVKATAEATVAKFEFNLNDTKATTASQPIDDLFKNSYTGSDGTTIIAKGSDTNKNVVAPGLSGKKEIKIENTGEVAIQIDTLTINETNTGNVPLKYAITTTNTTPNNADWKASDVLNSTLPADINSTIAIGDKNNTKSFYLHWKWDPASTDAADTTLGIKSQLDTISLDINLTVSQVTQ